MPVAAYSLLLGHARREHNLQRRVTALERFQQRGVSGAHLADLKSSSQADSSRFDESAAGKASSHPPVTTDEIGYNMRVRHAVYFYRHFGRGAIYRTCLRGHIACVPKGACHPVLRCALMRLNEPSPPTTYSAKVKHRMHGEVQQDGRSGTSRRNLRRKRLGAGLSHSALDVGMTSASSVYTLDDHWAGSTSTAEMGNGDEGRTGSSYPLP